ncbi:MAG: hypothetical protein HY651_10385 [Acidobacteria bacterium]|nr:hypothetical protein [Acidobacteriota bacterium]
MRCVHLNRVGEQCRDQALEGRQLCAFHSRILEDDDPAARQEADSGGEKSSGFPLIYRLAALVLLLIFLLEAFDPIRSWLGW